MSGYNKVYLHKGDAEEMTPLQLIYALGFDSNKYIGVISPVEMIERITGYHCDCGENKGEFDLLPVDDPSVVDGGKRYMKCRKCGAYSHL